MITANFGSFKDYDMKNRFFNRSLAGGALLALCAGWLALRIKTLRRRVVKGEMA